MINILLQNNIFITISIAIMCLLSILCLSILMHKKYLFLLHNRNIKKFEKIFWSGSNIENIYKDYQSDKLLKIGIGHIFKLMMKQYENKNNQTLSQRLTNISTGSILQIHASFSQYIQTIESIIHLAPMLGLFGTICGIIDVFKNVSQKGVNITNIAPSIANALITTAIGIALSMIAAILYNYINGKTDKMITKYHIFSLTLTNLMLQDDNHSNMSSSHQELQIVSNNNTIASEEISNQNDSNDEQLSETEYQEDDDI